MGIAPPSPKRDPERTVRAELATGGNEERNLHHARAPNFATAFHRCRQHVSLPFFYVKQAFLLVIDKNQTNTD